MAVKRISNDPRLRSYYSSISMQPKFDVAFPKVERPKPNNESRFKRRENNLKLALKKQAMADKCKNPELKAKFQAMADQLMGK